MSRSQKVNREITSLLQARTSLIQIVSREEKRVDAALLNSLPRDMRIRYWDIVSGLTETDPRDGKQISLAFVPKSTDGYSGNKSPSFSPVSSSLIQQGQQLATTDPLVVLQAIREVSERCLYVLHDISAYKDPITVRSIRNTCQDISSAPVAEQRAVVILTPSSEIHPDLVGHVNLLDYPLPDREEIEKIFSLLPLDPAKVQVPDAATKEAAIDAALGLSASEIQACFYRSLVVEKRINPALIAGEKKRVIAREKVLTWVEADSRGLSAIGGLGILKDWLQKRKAGFSVRAREYGLSPAKGCLLAGLPGGGKSLAAKCVSTAWGMPLLKLDLAGQKSKYVGDSEQNIRKALSIAEAVAPCVLWIDELDKAIGGGGEDGGVSKDQLGTILTWLQEKQAPVFLIATANDVRSLPPELLRKGRFDQLFWVDLPTHTERGEILLATLKQFKRSEGIDIQALSKKTEGWVGAEIASIVPEAMFQAFNDGERQITTSDLLTAAETVVPLSETMSVKLEEIRAFMKGKAINASYPESPLPPTQERERQTVELDL